MAMIALPNLSQHKSLDVMKDDMMQSVVHDLRTPITVIKGYLQLLLSGMMGEMSAEQADVLKRSVGPLEDLILMTDNLLQSMNLENGQIKLNREKTDLDKLISDALDFYQLPFQQRRMRLYRDGNTLGQTINVDPFWMKRVLQNLIWNAFKFTPDGGRVFIQVELADHGISISVNDSGRGIPADKLTHIFEKFAQASPEHDAKIGSGLGLWICNRVIELHGGKLSLTSKVGQGTRFTITLPE